MLVDACPEPDGMKAEGHPEYEHGLAGELTHTNLKSKA
jgi:hypothetical protein